MPSTSTQAFLVRNRRATNANTGHPLRAGRLAAAGAVLVSLLLGACGGSSPARTGAPSAADNAMKFSRCMREHGVKEFPNPEVSGDRVTLKFTTKAGSPGASPQTMEAAQNACKHFQAASQPNLSPEEKVAHEEAVLKFARCMREHGVTVHPSTSGGGMLIHVQRGSGGGPNPESPAFQSAQKACQGLFPPVKGGGGPTTGTQKGGGGGAGLSLSG